MREYWCEEMEHVAVIIDADDSHDAARQFAELYGHGVTATYHTTTAFRGYVTDWFNVHDENGEHVNDFMISDKADMDLAEKGGKA